MQELTNIHENYFNMNTPVPVYNQQYASRSPATTPIPVTMVKGQKASTFHTNHVANPQSQKAQSFESLQGYANVELKSQINKATRNNRRRNNRSLSQSRLVRSNTGSRKLLGRKRKHSRRQRRVHY